MEWSLAARHRWRAALQIHEQLLKAQRDRNQLELPNDTWRILRSQVALYQRALASAWRHAQEELAHEVQRHLSQLIQRYEQIVKDLGHKRPEPMPPSIIWGDLEGLPDEFEEVECELKSTEVRVVTSDIELEGIQLGRFQIILDWSKLGQSHCYRVIALDPNPAESKEDMVHPHLNQEYLCEGDGAVDIKQALLQGRLFDFFVLVRQILSTHNSSSAYLSMERWFGSQCQSCSTIVSQEHMIACACCDDLVCLDCSGACENCTDRMCQSCTKPCPHCENYFCSRCMIHCSACMADGCDACLKDGLCPACETPQENDDEEEPDAETNAVCLGEALVSA